MNIEMTLEEKMTRMDTSELQGLLETLQLTINEAPVLSEDQRKDLTASWQKVLAEIETRKRNSALPASVDYQGKMEDWLG